MWSRKSTGNFKTMKRKRSSGGGQSEIDEEQAVLSTWKTKKML
ncbi:hypothetical protein QG37_03621 [Candidozyma auris]|nr:hypothetical protein QG37_03621 [[Candida] auris]